ISISCDDVWVCRTETAADGLCRKSGDKCQRPAGKATNYSPPALSLPKGLCRWLRFAITCPLTFMNPDQFWTSQDGQILAVKGKDERTVALTLAFWPRHPAEFEYLKTNLDALRFTERSSLARIGIEMLVHGKPHVEGNRIELSADAFIYDTSFPNAPYWKKLLRIGAPVGRLFHAPAAAKLSTAEIWAAIKGNELKLPNTISIDSRGC